MPERDRLVLWDVDHTLLNAGGLSTHLYGVVFRELFGRDLERVAPMAGRTDRAIILDTLTLAGVAEPVAHVPAFVRGLTAQARGYGSRVRERGHALPGAVEALRALQSLARANGGARVSTTRAVADGVDDGARRTSRGARCPAGTVVQSVLTGNLRPLAEVKLGALGLARYLDLDVGAYGDVHEERARLVQVARDKAAAAYRTSFPGTATVLVGDTPLDVEAARATGARAVGVATGATSARDLAAAGAHAVLPDLTDTAAVLLAILGG